ncbi:hypothetical protein [Streptococcus halichoeri]|uniref:hypothetical protein n=1 Tax=Streptococcus halichoeri TaxID=254785 RepID=UPI00135BC820|nr:hypothetical protein [Streptococcus halichoeri]
MKKTFFKCIISILTISVIFPYFSTSSSIVKANDVIAVSQAEVDAVAVELENLFTNGILINGDSYTLNIDYLYKNYTPEEVDSFIALMKSSNLSSNTINRKKRSVNSFLVCMKDKAVADIADMFKVGAFVSFIQRKAWREAAQFAVSWLARNGIKRNVAATAALLSWYGVQCAGH